MTVANYTKKPIKVQAVQYNGNNYKEIFMFTQGKVLTGTEQDTLSINTPVGTMTANKEDWIIKGKKGEIYPCKPDNFKQTYEET